VALLLCLEAASAACMKARLGAAGYPGGPQGWQQGGYPAQQGWQQGGYPAQNWQQGGPQPYGQPPPQHYQVPRPSGLREWPQTWPISPCRITADCSRAAGLPCSAGKRLLALPLSIHCRSSTPPRACLGP
jgi:hypothetical protein